MRTFGAENIFRTFAKYRMHPKSFLLKQYIRKLKRISGVADMTTEPTGKETFIGMQTLVPRLSCVVILV